jgi:hypothetical protein
LRAELLSGAPVRSLRAGEIQVTNQTPPSRLGSQIARAVHGGIGGKTTSSGQPLDKFTRTIGSS